MIQFDWQSPSPALVFLTQGFASQHLMLVSDQFIDSLEYRLIGGLLVHSSPGWGFIPVLRHNHGFVCSEYFTLCAFSRWVCNVGKVESIHCLMPTSCMVFARCWNSSTVVSWSSKM